MSDEMIADLQRKLTAALQRIEELEEWRDFHNGLDYGAQSAGSPHPNQSINTAEYGGGAMRLDENGLQIKAENAAGRPAIFFLNDFEKFTPGSDPATYPFGKITGYAYSATTPNDDDFGGVRMHGYAAADRYAAVEADAYTRDGAAFDVAATMTAAFGSAAASVNVRAGESSLKVVEINGPLQFSNETADPAVLAGGYVWYRSDTDKLRAYINNVKENLATESYVAANGGVVKTPVMITPWSRNALGTGLGTFGNMTSVAWPSANLAIYVPFTLDESVTVVKGFWFNGGTVSGNVDIAIYNEAGTKQVSSGSTAQSGTDVLQEANIVDTALAAGRYYMALACNNTTAQFYRTDPDRRVQKIFGMAQQASAFALPSTATLAVVSNDYLPLFGFSLRTLVA